MGVLGGPSQKGTIPMNEPVKEVDEIREIVDRETRAWDTKDVDLLLTIFHPDMAWPWPRSSHSHDPLEWEFVLGKFEHARWKSHWSALFETHRLIHNRREIKKISISDERDAGMAVVDIDTEWRSRTGEVNLWKGRVCKVYSKTNGVWKMTMHTGVLEYA